MKKHRFTEEPIIAALKQIETGRAAADVGRELVIRRGTFHNNEELKKAI